MNHHKRASRPSFIDPEGFSDRVTEWMESFAPVLEAVAFLRELGGEGPAVEALLSTADVTGFRLSIELWFALAQGCGDDPEDLLAPLLGAAWLPWLRFILWGEERPASPHLSLVG